MNRLISVRILPALAVYHFIAALSLILSTTTVIDVSVQRETFAILADQNANSARLLSLGYGDDSIFSDPNIAANTLPGTVGGQQKSLRTSITRFYHLEDIAASNGMLSQLSEIQNAIDTGSGFSRRNGDGMGTIVFAAARLVERKDDPFLIHSIISQENLWRSKLLASGILAFASILSFSILAATILRMLKKAEGNLLQISTGLELYAEGELNYRIRNLEGGMLSDIAQNMEQMAVRHSMRITELTKQREELESILSTMHEGIVLIDRFENILMANQSALNLFSIAHPPQNMIGASIVEVFRSGELTQVVERLIETAESKRQRIMVFNSNQGTYRTLEVTGLFIDPGHMPDARILLVFHDLSDLLRLEQIRRDFVSNVSHELKTPITTIQGFAETLAEGAIDDTQVARGFVQIILKQSRRMEQIVSDLLILSRLEQQGSELQFRTASLSQMMADVIDVCSSPADAKEISIHCNISGKDQATVNANLLEQAIINLVDNAIKYGKFQGNVWVNVENSKDELSIIVRDDGAGIAKRDIPRLFERFYRVDKARSSSMGGTGLGLAIVKHIAMAHGGTVEADSAIRMGSTFHLSIPQPPNIEVEKLQVRE